MYRKTQSKLLQPTTGTSEDLFLFISQPTELRRSPTYYHWYHVVVNSAVMIVAPSVIMVYCSHSVYRHVGRIEGTWHIQGLAKRRGLGCVNSLPVSAWL